MKLKRMGVMNITPNSFSDGGELSTPSNILSRLQLFGPIEALDIGAESTAPQNDPITWQEEWQRFQLILPCLKQVQCPLSIDTYHPETIFKIAALKLKHDLIWNDISGKFDDSVHDFLKLSERYHYVFCHNLAPSRELSGKHMLYTWHSKGEAFLRELAEYFKPHRHERVIFDPCLGFSKSYEQNWMVIDHFQQLQNLVPHDKWLLGFSRKSFLRKKYGLEKITSENRDRLDELHLKELQKIKFSGELWIRTHRPELV